MHVSDGLVNLYVVIISFVDKNPLDLLFCFEAFLFLLYTALTDGYMFV